MLLLLKLMILRASRHTSDIWHPKSLYVNYVRIMYILKQIKMVKKKVN